MLSSPYDEATLLKRAYGIAGYTLGDLARELGRCVPANLNQDKGWIGILLESYLGASAKSKPERDFTNLGIELKTIPVDKQGYPLETTFVSVAPLVANHGVTWESSHVRYKLQKVLWIPIEGLRTIALKRRRIGRPILWSPSLEEEHALKQDWQELMDMIVLGQIEKITARQGEYLQLRPKAANGKVTTAAIDEQGNSILVRPLGFYLKKHFTASILRQALARS